MSDRTTEGPERGSLEKFQLNAQQCRTADDLAMLVRDASSQVMWINQLLTAAMRDVLYYDRSHTEPYMNLHHTEALMREDMYRAIELPGAKSTAVARDFNHDQLSNLVAATSALFAASRAATLAARSLNANADYLTRSKA